MTISKKAQMISCMTEALAENVSIYETVQDRHRDFRPYYGYGEIGQQQSRTGLKRQIQTIRAELLELDKLING